MRSGEVFHQFFPTPSIKDSQSELYFSKLTVDEIQRLGCIASLFLSRHLSARTELNFEHVIAGWVESNCRELFRKKNCTGDSK